VESETIGAWLSESVTEATRLTAVRSDEMGS
jgi:hypothetical protein